MYFLFLLKLDFLNKISCSDFESFQASHHPFLVFNLEFIFRKKLFLALLHTCHVSAGARMEHCFSHSTWWRQCWNSMMGFFLLSTLWIVISRTGVYPLYDLSSSFFIYFSFDTISVVLVFLTDHYFLHSKILVLDSV